MIKSVGTRLKRFVVNHCRYRNWRGGGGNEEFSYCQSCIALCIWMSDGCHPIL